MSYRVTDETSNPFEIDINGEAIEGGKSIVVNLFITPIGQLTPTVNLSFLLDPLKAKALGMQLQDAVKIGRQRKG